MLSSLFAKRRTACPYCYQDLDVNQVAFRCSGMGAPGRPACEPAPDPKRRQLFNDTEPVLPAIRKGAVPQQGAAGSPAESADLLGRESVTCGDCGGQSGVRLCPACHSLLPRSLANDSPLFGLVGAPNSGKTVLLSRLHKELTSSVARRFDASIVAPGGESGFAGELARYEEEMSKGRGELPQKTGKTGAKKKPPAVYEWKYRRGRTTSATIFSFYDSAGEDVSRQEETMKQQYLGQSSGIILLLDPFSFPENIARAEQRGANPEADSDLPESVLNGITYVLQTAHSIKRSKRIRVPLAVVISKIDAFLDQVPQHHPLRKPGGTDGVFDEAESQDNHEHIKSMVERWGGDGLLRKLEHEYANYRLFGVSALGAEPDYRARTVNARGVLPHRVPDPLLWLMATRGFIPSNGK
ncbi:MAG: TRAFAC clade GTPase domain-containing protein [Brevibacterium yomogidense]|uniref:TRAFAC clade GTPase domain-containing protein n=1 Tax=Brevibacterium sp. Mu109 TaxID=1255669 RepID=UPI000C604A68|nr:hypothetical protein [Brevibacterium sp. Mu109]SMX89692.1 hypothetical protein BSP109_02404 [Brevibacterium sp. Mu109]